MGVRGGKIHSMEEFLIVDSLASAPPCRRSPSCASPGRPHELPRPRRATGERFPRHLPDGEADRRRLHQPAGRPRRRWSPSSTRSGRAFDARGGHARPATSTCSCSRTRRPARSAAPARCSARSASSQPFYTYHLSTLTQTSPELGKTFRNQMLTLTTDLEGSSRGRRAVPPSRDARRRLGRAARAQPLSVHEAASRALRRRARWPSFAG